MPMPSTGREDRKFVFSISKQTCFFTTATKMRFVDDNKDDDADYYDNVVVAVAANDDDVVVVVVVDNNHDVCSCCY